VESEATLKPEFCWATGKRRYPSCVYANWALDMLRLKAEQHGQECPLKRSYECPLCNAWHLTSQKFTRAKQHQVEPGAPFCSCGQDTVTCQSCGQLACGNLVVQHGHKNYCMRCAFSESNKQSD
jgi:hypothetical protein